MCPRISPFQIREGLIKEAIFLRMTAFNDVGPQPEGEGIRNMQSTKEKLILTANDDGALRGFHLVRQNLVESWPASPRAFSDNTDVDDLLLVELEANLLARRCLRYQRRQTVDVARPV